MEVIHKFYYNIFYVVPYSRMAEQKKGPAAIKKNRSFTFCRSAYIFPSYLLVSTIDAFIENYFGVITM